MNYDVCYYYGNSRVVGSTVATFDELDTWCEYYGLECSTLLEFCQFLSRCYPLARDAIRVLTELLYYCPDGTKYEEIRKVVRA